MICRAFIFILMAMTTQPAILYNFSNTSNAKDWVIVDDVVMGGRSSGNFYVNKAGNGVFEGRVSLENNGGFSSLRYRLNQEGIKEYTSLILKIKGDGNKYQIRIKDKRSNYYSYASYFKSPTYWETIKIPLSQMYPTFRGRQVDIPNYNGDTIEEIAFLIGNKKAEDFKLEIDFVGLE